MTYQQQAQLSDQSQEQETVFPGGMDIIIELKGIFIVED